MGLKISEETEGRTLSMTMTPTKTEAHSTGMPVIAIFFAPPTILIDFEQIEQGQHNSNDQHDQSDDQDGNHFPAVIRVADEFCKHCYGKQYRESRDNAAENKADDVDDLDHSEAGGREFTALFIFPCKEDQPEAQGGENGGDACQQTEQERKAVDLRGVLHHFLLHHGNVRVAYACLVHKAVKLVDQGSGGGRGRDQTEYNGQ